MGGVSPISGVAGAAIGAGVRDRVLRIEQTERAKFWLRVMREIRNRGTHDGDTVRRSLRDDAG